MSDRDPHGTPHRTPGGLSAERPGNESPNTASSTRGNPRRSATMLIGAVVVLLVILGVLLFWTQPDATGTAGEDIAPGEANPAVEAEEGATGGAETGN